MNYENILQFKGTWRVYQARVLDRAEHYVRDGKIHIVAAPGSGKTTLGIELIRRLQGTALVLVPTITIREQWIARIKEAFLCDGVDADAYLSQSLKEPRAITVTTYQALHSAMTQIQDGEEDYQGFSLLQVLQDAKVDTLCLDECHHLRSEWWKSLESLKEKLSDVTTIALTATPPYDSTPVMWNRYIAMCGEIDEEITTPELVKEGSLCPHQDYVYFNYPTKQEEAEVMRYMQAHPDCEELDPEIEKHLTNSLGKIESIRQITQHEYASLHGRLHMLILTDYIRKEHEKSIGNREADVNLLGVLPLFENLRRDAQDMWSDMRLGVLCGSIIVIPAGAKDELFKTVGDAGTVTFSKLGSLPETEYVKVSAVGDSHFLIPAVTQLFADGYIQVLIGTKSLLGEGWDSPCINSLILASTVGSFMLSNQMRGRAIRTWDRELDKTSNIWHLVCLKPWYESSFGTKPETSEDYRMLTRRMEHFLGLHYTENVIENGLARLSIIQKPFTKANVANMNATMLALSKERSRLRERWNRSLTIYPKMEVVTEVKVRDKAVPRAAFHDAVAKMIFSIFLLCAAWYMAAQTGAKTGSAWLGTLAGIFTLAGLGMLSYCFPKMFMLGSPYERLKTFGRGIRKALEKQKLLDMPDSKVVTETPEAYKHVVYLQGGSGRDGALFSRCVNEFFAPVENQKYILVKHGRQRGNDRFFAVPDCFSAKKEQAEQFTECMRPYIGAYDCVYTRAGQGNVLLQEAQKAAYANQEARCSMRRKVTGRK